MSKIVKKMKIMQPDGTLSDYVSIGAEAENINVDGESVETKLGKKPYYYDTVADMKVDTKLKAGDMVVTLGYYNINDGNEEEGEENVENNNELEGEEEPLEQEEKNGDEEANDENEERPFGNPWHRWWTPKNKWY